MVNNVGMYCRYSKIAIIDEKRQNIKSVDTFLNFFNFSEGIVTFCKGNFVVLSNKKTNFIKISSMVFEKYFFFNVGKIILNFQHFAQPQLQI